MMFVLWVFLMLVGSGSFAAGAYFICAEPEPAWKLLALGFWVVAYQMWRLAIVLPPSKLPPDIRNI